ncbi:MAG: SHOCT domain-containing protein [Haloferacaceae archaeon]
MFTTLRRLLFAPVFQWGPHHPQGPHWGGGGGHHWGTGGMGAGVGAGVGGLPLLLWLVVLVALLALVAYALVRGWEVPSAGNEDDAVSVLRSRYARGDVDDEEFARRYERLTGDSSSH